MPMIAMGVGVGAQALSSYIGGKQAAKAAEAALAQQKEFTAKAINELEKLGVPTVKAQEITLQNPKMVYDFIPKLQQTFPELKSHFEQISTDPRLKEMQTEALMGIQNRAEGGLTPEDEAQISDLYRGVAQQANARDSTILQNMEQRGIGGSGAELSSRLASSQSATQQAALDAQDLAAKQYRAKLDALQQMGEMAQSQQAQEFSQAGQKASALDTIAQLNQAARYNIQSSNVDAQNRATQAATEMKQQLENQRATIANAQEQHNKELIQQQYQNQLAKSQSIANAYVGAGSQALQAGATAASNKQAMWSGIGNAAMGGAQLYGAASKNTGNTTNKSVYNQEEDEDIR